MLERIPAKTYVFRQGDPSNDKFYIIMQGSISVIVKHDKNVFNQEYFEQFGIESANALLSKRTRQSGVSGRRESKFVRGSKIEEIQALSVRPSIPNSSKPITNFSKKYYIQYFLILRQMTQNAYVHNPTIMSDLISHMGVKTKEMYAGEAFGEKALLNKDAVRSTTILTNVDTDFIIMSKEDYLNIVRKYDKRRLKKAEFMKKNIPAIEHIVSEEIWDDMYHLIKEADFSKDSLLTEEGDFGTVIFFLCEGFCQLTKKVVAEYEKDKELHPKERILVEKTVNLVGAGSILGEEILYDDQPYRYTITVNISLMS